VIWKVIEIHLRRLRHNRVEWLLTFIVPIAFFSIFALIFTRGVGSTPRVKVALVNATAATDKASISETATTETTGGSQRCQRILEQLEQSEGLRIIRGASEALTVDRATAETMVRRGTVTIAVVMQSTEDQLSAELLNDASDQVASQVVTALVTRAMMTAGTPNMPSDAPTPQASFAPPKIEIINVIGQDKSNPIISVYAAGIAVMFLLFGASSGGGVLLEERENQTLERLLATQMTMDQLLLGKWFYLTLLGCVQVTVMFLWAQLVFGLDLMGHLDGFAMMTVATSAAAASFGLFLATLCRTRGQLGGLSVVAVLTMSALGGSMVPRYVMSESLREAGLWTFNAWALDGYDKVFWRELPPNELGPQLAVLMGTAFLLLAAARLLAIRWEVN
jgi:ABC-2 type transport system permease protein